MDLIPEDKVNGADNGVCEKDVNNVVTRISYLSKMAAVDIEFNDVTYSVPIPRGNQLLFKTVMQSIR